jgi:hypothetical protein
VYFSAQKGQDLQIKPSEKCVDPFIIKTDILRPARFMVFSDVIQPDQAAFSY